MQKVVGDSTPISILTQLGEIDLPKPASPRSSASASARHTRHRFLNYVAGAAPAPGEAGAVPEQQPPDARPGPERQAFIGKSRTTTPTLRDRGVRRRQLGHQPGRGYAEHRGDREQCVHHGIAAPCPDPRAPASLASPARPTPPGTNSVAPVAPGGRGPW
jgi:hypothetical protein